MLKWTLLSKLCGPTTVTTASGEVQTHVEAIVYVKKLDTFLSVKILVNTPAVSSLGKLCDENGCSYEWINGQKPHLIKDGIRIICNTENFVPIVVPGLTSSSSTSSSSSRTPMKQESRFSSSSSSSPSSPAVSEIQIREREDGPNSDISPVQVSNSIDDRSGPHLINNFVPFVVPCLSTSSSSGSHPSTSMTLSRQERHCSTSSSSS